MRVRPRGDPGHGSRLRALGGDSVRLLAVTFGDRTTLFAHARGSPVPDESPAVPGLYVVEHDDRLWLLRDTSVVPLTRDTAAGIRRDTLRRHTREAGPYLYWATRPVWHPSRLLVAYVTNRTWMLSPGSGQELWLADVETRAERPLLSRRGEFFYPSGWFGDELLFLPRGESGIPGVDIRTGARRRVAEGSAEAFSRDGARLLYMTGPLDSLRAHVLSRDGVTEVPEPPAGEALTHGGAFSPSGERVLLGTSFSRDSGITRALYVFDTDSRRLTQITRWSFRQDNPHPQGLPVWLDDSTLLVTRFDRVTRTESGALLRVPRVR